MDLSTQLATVPTLDPAAPAWQFDGSWRPWSYLSEATGTLDAALAGPAPEPGAQVGLLMRNRPEVAATAIALLTGRRCLVTLSTAQPAATTADELRGLRLPAVLAAERDVGPELTEACRAAGTALLVVTESGGPVAVRVRTEVPGDRGAGHVPPAPEVAVRMLTSGTTGRPKRVELLYRSLEIEAASTRRYSGTGQDRATGQDGLRLASGVAINWMPLVHVAGVRALIASVLDGRRLSLMERFTVEGWVALIREHRPKVGLLVPTTLRMVYDAGVPKDVFESVSAVFVGTAALDPAFAAEFSARYEVPVLVIYGATEFAGGVAGWTLRDWRRFGAEKPDSVGRANAGIELRAVDPDSGAELPADRPGVLEVRGEQLAEPGWVRTTDLARIDADGFLYILGRADDVIIRGGLKVQASDVAAALREHPAVHDAAVIGVPDPRLGAVPVAGVELEPGADAGEPELSAHLRARLAAYQIPVRIAVLEALPRTPSMKVSQPELRRLMGLAP
jgi:acyl-CoA synthetase (AMP-forming)/AMP-acid ligase II